MGLKRFYEEYFLIINIIIIFFILYIEKGFFVSSEELVIFNLFGRTPFALPIIVAIIFVFLSKDRLFHFKEKFDFKIFFIFIIINLFAFLCYFFLKIFIINHFHFAQKYFYLFLLLRYIFPLIMIISLVIAFFGLTFWKSFKIDIFISLVLGFLFLNLSFLFQNLWKFFANHVATHAYFFVKLVLPFARLDLSLRAPVIATNSIAVMIDKECSGIESLSMFVFMFLFVILLERKKIKNWLLIILLLVVGLCLTYIINVLRIFLVLLFANFIDPLFAIQTFHSETAWLIFTFYVIVFFAITYPWILGMKLKQFYSRKHIMSFTKRIK